MMIKMKTRTIATILPVMALVSILLMPNGLVSANHILTGTIADEEMYVTDQNVIRGGYVLCKK